MITAFHHVTVMLKETVDELNINPNGTYVDCTLGGGGHTAYLLERLNEKGKVFAFDQDMTAIAYAKHRFKKEIENGRLVLVHQNFRHLEEALKDYHLNGVDGILYDLGVSSPQIDNVERGFSYKQDAPLDMRMDQTQELTAEEIVNRWEQKDLIRIFKRYGEEKFSKPIARSIVQTRERHPITRTSELVEIIRNAIPAPARRKGGHPAKRIFQALRIAVNDELGAVEESLQQALKLIKKEGRVAVITFHSLEDRIVKVMFKEATTPPELPKNLPVLPKDVPKANYHLVTTKPIYPNEEEISKNRRSHSAKLRVIERK